LGQNHLSAHHRGAVSRERLGGHVCHPGHAAGPCREGQAGQKISNPQSEFQLQLIPVDLNRVPPILLQTFFVVAEVGQISEAARRLHLSQPAVTGHIRRLEANLETTLFIRSARGVTLTPLGARLRERLHHVFTELEQVLGELDLSREVTGIVTLAASTTLARYFVPRIFLRFHQYHPAAALNLIMGNTEQVLDHLREHRVGLGLVEGHQHSPGAPRGVPTR
jgi:DNA-binding transcriptional LysR family regulator